ncbi:MAG: GNAT family N-acetyltransferase [Chitinophagaceae bacterium]
MLVKEVPLTTVLQVRRDVMYPEENIDFVKLEGDENGLHLGLYADEQLVSVISVFEQGTTVQFRKFATVTAMQGKGYGTQLLEYVFDWAIRNGKKRIWCNARVSATALYLKFGMQPTGSTWQKYGLEFIKMEKQF